MLLHINGKFTMVKLKQSLLSQSSVLNRPSMSISRCMKEVELDVILQAKWDTCDELATKPFELFSERTPSI